MESAYNTKEIGEAIADSLVMMMKYLEGQNDFGVGDLARRYMENEVHLIGK